MQLIFGAGALWGTRNDVTGIGPDQFAILNDISIDFDFELKELYGQYQFPLDEARGKGKISGKAKSARVFASLYGDVFFGVSPTTGTTTTSENEAANVPASTPYTVTVANAATFVKDLGVFYASGANAGKKLINVVSPSSAGQYSVNTGTGVYTFAAADASAAVLISYRYSVAASGYSIAINNQFMGVTPAFEADFHQSAPTANSAGSMDLALYKCMSTKFSLPFKIDDYMIPEFDFSAMANAAGQIGLLSVSE